MVTSVFFIVILFVTLVSLLRNHSSHSFIISSTGQALEKIIITCFSFSLAVLCLKPEISTVIANLVGVGRGSDFVIYIFSIFSFYCLVRLLKQIKELNAKISKLAIEISLITLNVKSVDTLLVDNSSGILPRD